MRVCVVGCGAVGSLFAADLATLDDVEVWAFDLNRRTLTLSTRTDCNYSEQARYTSKPRGDDATRRDPRRATSASSRRRQCMPTPRSRQPHTRSPTAPSRR